MRWNLRFVRGRAEPSDLLLLHYDAGVGEAAAADAVVGEGAKGAGEAAAAEGAAGAGAADAAGGGLLAAGADDAALAAFDATGATAGLDAAGAAGGGLLASGADDAALAGFDASQAGAAGAASGIASEATPGLFNAGADSQLASSQLGITGADTAAAGGPSSVDLGSAAVPSGNTGGLSSTASAPTGGGSDPGLPFNQAQDSQLANVQQGLTANSGSASPAIPSNGTPSLVDRAMDALGSGASKVGNGIVSNPLQAASLGLTALSAKRQAGATGTAQSQLNAVAAPASATSAQLLSQFQSGQISGADAYQISQYATTQKAQVDSYYAKAGLTNSSMHQQALQKIDQQAEAMRQQAVQNLLKDGLSAAGVANPVLTAGVNAGVQEDKNAQLAMSNFINALAKMNTGSASPAPAGGG